MCKTVSEELGTTHNIFYYQSNITHLVQVMRSSRRVIENFDRFMQRYPSLVKRFISLNIQRKKPVSRLFNEVSQMSSLQNRTNQHDLIQPVVSIRSLQDSLQDALVNKDLILDKNVTLSQVEYMKTIANATINILTRVTKIEMNVNDIKEFLHK